MAHLYFNEDLHSVRECEPEITAMWKCSWKEMMMCLTFIDNVILVKVDS